MAFKQDWKAVQKAYDAAQFFYDIFWNTRTHGGINYGYWTAQTKSISQATKNLFQLLYQEGVQDTNKQYNILDAGCGVGGMIKYFSTQYTSLQLTGINISHKQLNICRKKNKENNSIFYNQNYLNTTFKDNSFDLIYAIESMFHTAQKDRFLAEMYRILRPSGKLIVGDYFLTNKDYTSEEYAQLKDWWTGYESPPVIHLDQFESLGKATDFDQIQLNDISQAVLPASKRIHNYGQLGVKIAKVLNAFKINIGLDIKNAKATVQQYNSLKDGLWIYGIITLKKN